MPKALTKDIIQERINESNYICESYNLETKRFHYICTKGHHGKMRMDHWKRGVRCSTCSGNKKLEYVLVFNYFKKYGYILLTKYYINTKLKLKYKCPKGHINYMNFNNFKSGCRCPECNNINHTGENNPYISSGAINRYHKTKHYNWKGGVSETNLPLYDTYVLKFIKYQKVKKYLIDGLEVFSISCKYCGKFYVPTKQAVSNRLRVITGKLKDHGQYNFYCSYNCKKACPNFRKHKYPKGFKPSTSREVQPALRKLVLKRDNYKCQICDITIENSELHCHHITGVELNPIESADLDNCITLCKHHHKQVHKLPGCGYNDLSC